MGQETVHPAVQAGPGTALPDQYTERLIAVGGEGDEEWHPFPSLNKGNASIIKDEPAFGPIGRIAALVDGDVHLAAPGFVLVGDTFLFDQVPVIDTGLVGD